MSTVTQPAYPALVNGVTPSEMELIHKLDRDLRGAARLLGRHQVRNMVDTYYQIQDYRKSGANQTRAQGETAEPNQLVEWLGDSMRRLEDNIKRAMGEFAGAYRVGQWLQGLTGIGPVISAGLLAHLDVRRAPTVGHFWSFAGINPEMRWLSNGNAQAIVHGVAGKHAKKLAYGQLDGVAAAANLRVNVLLRRLAFLQHKAPGEPVSLDADKVVSALCLRPWNEALKRLCFIAGDCFVKFSNHPKQYYGTVYQERKGYEAKINLGGGYTDSAEYTTTGKCPRCANAGAPDRACHVCHGHAEVTAKRLGKETDARQWYSGEWVESAKLNKDGADEGTPQPMLPPARMHMRALRYTSKLFLSHLHHVMHWDYYGKAPPKPFGLERVPGDHRHFVAVPNWNEDEPFDGYDGESITRLLVD